MARLGIEVHDNQTINLAYMECFTSCVLTYLNFNGYDYKKVLLDYWNLSYQFKTLLSSKHVQNMPLNYLYGIEMRFSKGESEEMLLHVRDGNGVLCFCQASKLDYFPRENLGMESSGFQHSILIYGWDPGSNQYIIADPTVNTIVQMRADEILKAGTVRMECDELHYFILTKPARPYLEPDMKQCARYGAKRNYSFYSNLIDETISSTDDMSDEERKRKLWQQRFSNRKDGKKALDAFEADFAKSVEWTPQARSAWLKRNTMMMSSINRIRSTIWNTYLETDCIAPSKVQEGQDQIDSIGNLWNTINFKLLRYMKADKYDSAVHSITLLIDKLKQAELRFLEWLIATAEGE